MMSFSSVSRPVTGPICTGVAAGRHHIGCPRLMSPVRQRNNVSVSRGKLRNLSVCPSVAYEVQTNEGMNDEAEDFYAILGVVSPKMVQVHL